VGAAGENLPAAVMTAVPAVADPVSKLPQRLGNAHEMLTASALDTLSSARQHSLYNGSRIYLTELAGWP
jgi:hypothetical protein